VQRLLHEGQQIQKVSLWFEIYSLYFDPQTCFGSKYIHYILTLKLNKQPSKNRVCRVGAGEEMTKNKADTPGFKLIEHPLLEHNHKHCLKLNLTRNHPRVVQSSLDLLQSWRANCDIQLLIYSSDPKNPDVQDIARVTDYVVAYACKGNKTLKEERDQIKNMAMA